MWFGRSVAAGLAFCQDQGWAAGGLLGCPPSLSLHGSLAAGDLHRHVLCILLPWSSSCARVSLLSQFSTCPVSCQLLTFLAMNSFVSDRRYLNPDQRHLTQVSEAKFAAWSQQLQASKDVFKCLPTEQQSVRGCSAMFSFRNSHGFVISSVAFKPCSLNSDVNKLCFSAGMPICWLWHRLVFCLPASSCPH